MNQAQRRESFSYSTGDAIHHGRGVRELDTSAVAQDQTHCLSALGNCIGHSHLVRARIAGDFSAYAPSPIAATASARLFSGGLLRAMDDKFEFTPPWDKVEFSFSPDSNIRRESGRRLILLLAEDHPPDAMLVREAIEMENLPIELHVAITGQQVIDFFVAAELRSDAPMPHLLLLDLNLPKIHGLEVLRRIRCSRKCNNIPVLVVTASDSLSDRSRAANLGASYFRKPTTYDEFLQVGPVLRQFLTANGLL